jgi:hypothetical protein
MYESISDEIDVYQLVRALTDAEDPRAVVQWLRETVPALDGLRRHRWEGISDKQRTIFDDKIVPFLERLAEAKPVAGLASEQATLLRF